MLFDRADGARSWSYQPQLSIGVSPTFDLLLQPSWIHAHPGEDVAVSGFGDTNLDFKWRFYGRAPWSFGVRAGLQLATAEADLGLPRKTFGRHEVLVATYDDAPFTVHGNLGLTQYPRHSAFRREVFQSSAALMWAASERCIFTVETAATSAQDPVERGWSVTSLGGLIYTLIPGLDVDVGYQASLKGARTSTWLAGLTYRFAI